MILSDHYPITFSIAVNDYSDARQTDNIVTVFDYTIRLVLRL